MDDLLYNSCLRYFTSLANFGFKSESDVKKLLFYVFIQELVNTTSIAIPEDDYKCLENALYSLYGTTCLIPYPDYCERPMYAHLGDIAELSARMAKAEKVNAQQDNRLDSVEEVNNQQDLRLNSVEAVNAEQNERLDNHEGRINAIEGTHVAKDETSEEINIDDIIIK